MLLAVGAQPAWAQLVYGVVTPYGGGAAYGYDPYWGDPYPPTYDPYVLPYTGVWTLPPIVMPAESVYGPQVMRQFMGLNQPQAPIVQNNTIVTTPAAPPVVAAPRASNAQARQLAGEFVRQGDNYFQHQQFNLAYDRYKAALSAAPDLADTSFRQGLALTAMGQYARAGEAIRRGMKIDDGWPHARFRLSALYQNNAVAKEAVLDALALEAADHPTDPNLLYLLGVELYFDNQQARSRPFFEQAQRLTVGDDDHVAPFITALDELARAQGRREL